MGEHETPYQDLLERLTAVAAAMQRAVDAAADDTALTTWLMELDATATALSDTSWSGVADVRAVEADLLAALASAVPFDGLVAQGFATRLLAWVELFRDDLPQLPAGPPPSDRARLRALVHDLQGAFRAAQLSEPPPDALKRAARQLERVTHAMEAFGEGDLAAALHDLSGDVQMIARSPVSFDGIVAASITSRYERLIDDLLDAIANAPDAAVAATGSEPTPAVVSSQADSVAAPAPPAEPVAASAPPPEDVDEPDVIVSPSAEPVAAPAPPPPPEVVDPETGAIEHAVGLASVAVMMLEDGEDAELLGGLLEKVEALHDALRKDVPPDIRSLVLGVKAHLATRVHTEDPIEGGELSALTAGLHAVQEAVRATAKGQTYDVNVSGLLDALVGLYDSTDTPIAAPTVGATAAAVPTADDEMPTLVRLLSDQDSHRILGAFLEDIKHQVDTLEHTTLNWEADPRDAELLRAIFRSVHTIKGDAGLIGYPLLNQVFHALENILSQLREGEIPFRKAHAQLVLENTDLLTHLMRDLETGLAMKSVDQWVPMVTDSGLSMMLARINEVIAQDAAGAAAAAPELVPMNVFADADADADADAETEADTDAPLGELLVEAKAITSDQLAGALQRQKELRQGTSVRETVKVRLDRLDTLLDLVGELSIAQTMLATRWRALDHHDSKADDFDKMLGQFGKLTGDIQDRAMAMRMVPVKRSFQKMQRLVRDLAQRAGKEVQLTMVGEDTEIDKTVVEELADPMMHLIRNALDHGVELPAEREAAGKPRAGNVRLEAYHVAGNIVLEVADDGRGVDLEAVRKRGEERGLVESNTQLSEQQTYQLLFAPGFSLAPQVTEISGRGVGMDVVKKNVERLRGRIEVESTLGVGTTFRVKLPLTLAIIDGMVVKVGEERYIIPLLSIWQSIRPERGQVQTVPGGGEFVQTRDALLPLVRLHRLYHVATDTEVPWEGLVVIVGNEDDRAALLVDDLLGQQQVVVKALGDMFGHLRGLSGATIMGDGRVGLILDVPTLVEYART